MTSTINFLEAIGHTDKVYIRCLAPKNTPIPELQTRGMTWTTKDGEIKKSTIDGYIDLQSGQFQQKYGDKFKSITDGWGHLENRNQQDYGVYFIVHHGGVKNSEITHGTTLFHESDRATLDEQQQVIDRISSEFGKPTAVVKTRKSLHAYWSSSETISIDTLPTFQRRWMQYSNCDDVSLSDPAQLMRLPGFDHVSWNPDMGDFDRVQCELLQLNNVNYSLEQFDRYLPELDTNQWVSRSLMETVDSEASDTDMRILAEHLPGFDSSGKWIKAKCPAHDGESSDSLHIDSQTGGFICHAGCSSSSVYNATKARAVAAGYRFEVEESDNEDLTRLLQSSNYDPSSALPSPLRELIRAESNRWTIPPIVYVSSLLAVIGSLSKVSTRLHIRETSGKPILWVGIVGTSNSGKSESLRTITSPLEALQRGANEEYEAAMLQYESELEVWEKRKKQKDSEPGDKPKEPGCREFYMDDYTYEALAHVYQYQKDRCFILKIDELKGFCEFEKYGTTNNRSRILSLYDADGMKVNRKSSKRIHIETTGISVVGTTQYTTLSRILEKDDNKEDGLWARFVFVNLPTTPTYSHDPECDNRLYTSLAGIYAKVNGFSACQFGASSQAKELWTGWYNEMVSQTVTRNDGFIESIYGKAKDRVARIALDLHLLHAAAAGTSPKLEISAETLHHAIELGKCLLLETEKCLALVGATTDPDEERIINFVSFFTGKDWIDTSRTRGWWSPKPKPTNQESRDFMAKVVSLGYAIDNDKPKNSIEYKINVQKSGQSGQREPNGISHKGLTLTTPGSAEIDLPNEIKTESAHNNGFTNQISLTTSGSAKIATSGLNPNGADVSDIDKISLTTSGSADKTVSNPYETVDTPNDAKDSLTYTGSVSKLYPASVSASTDPIDHFSGFIYENHESENLKSMADSLSALVQLSDDEALDGLNDLYSIWTSPQMSEASKLLKTTNSTAFDRLGELVVKRKSSQSEATIAAGEIEYEC